MKVNFFDINIIDTQEDVTVVSLEKTALSVPTLIYNGAENLHQKIMTSELSFSFLVKELSTAYKHLFTGSETRYKVELVDVSVYNYPRVIWVGFLLPEQFSEPYKHSNYFVDFIATDGVALLKDKSFSATIDLDAVANLSVLEVINQCLLKIGLTLPIRFSEAIQSAVWGLSYLDLEVNTESYKTDTGYETAFKVLENCLGSIGCKLFQYTGYWYVIGLNQQKEKTVIYKEYLYNDVANALEYVKTVSLNKDLVKYAFVGTPTITLLPPFKTVASTWDADFNDSLIPVDAVSHLPVNLATDPDDTTAKYWHVETDKGAYIFVYYYTVTNAPDATKYFNGYIATSNKEIENPFAGLIFQGDPILCLRDNNQTIFFADIDSNYITLLDSFYVNGSEDLERYGSLEIEFQIGAVSLAEDIKSYFDNEGFFNSLSDNGSGLTRVNSTAHGLNSGDWVILDSTASYTGEYQVTVIDVNNFDISAAFVGDHPGNWKINPFKNHFFFAVTYKENLTDSAADEELYLSNFTTTGVADGMYDFNLSLNKDVVKGVLNIEKMLFIKDGYYNLRFYFPVTHSLIGLNRFLFLNKCNFTLKTENDVLVEKTRNIDFTTTQDLSNFHVCSRLENTNRNFLISDALQARFLNGTESFKNYTAAETLFVLDGSNKQVVLVKDDVLKVNAGFKVYKKNKTTEVLTEVTIFFISLEVADYGVMYTNDSKVAFITVTTEEELYLALPTTLPNADAYHVFKALFNRVGVVEVIEWQECLAKIYHDLYQKPVIRFSGQTQGLVGPLDLVELFYEENLECTPVKMTINLSEGITDVVVIENVKELVDDYE